MGIGRNPVGCCKSVIDPDFKPLAPGLYLVLCMATLGLGHKRGRSASTTTAIQRPAILTTRTMSSAKTTTTTMTSGNRPRRPSTEGMSGLPITVNVHSKARTSTIGYMGWLGSMASGMSDYLHSPREHEHESTVSSSTHSLSFSGPPSPAHTTALPDWSPRAANRVPVSLLACLLSSSFLY